MPVQSFFAVLALAAAAAPAITLVNDAGLADAELVSIRTDFARWYGRVYAHHNAEPTPVTVKLTREVPFGFYRDGTVLLPPSKDRGAMIEDFAHELTHHVIGRASSFFFREGAATHTVDALFALERRVPQGWPYFGRSCDAWTALFAQGGKLLPLREQLGWPEYRGATADEDFRSWQTYLSACSFVGWYRARHGLDGFRRAFAAQWPAEDAAQAEAAWLRALAERRAPAFDPAAVLPMKSRRYRGYVERLRP